MQCDIDVFGDNSINAELDVLKTTLETYKVLGFEKLTLKLNDRRILSALVNNAGFKAENFSTVCVALDKIDKIGINGMMMELIEKGFDAESINKLVDIVNDVLENGLNVVSKYGVEQNLVDDLNYLISTLNLLTNNEFEIVFDISIIRGQGYYTGIVFEFYSEGLSSAIGGGGRYDKMIEKIVGINVPAVGASIGFERISLILLERGATFGGKENLVLLYDKEDDIVEVFKIKDELRKEYNVSIYLRPKNMKNFYEKIVEVATKVTSVKDYKEGKEIKSLA